MKKCKKCKVEKEYEFFNKSTSSKDGYRGICKDCRKIYLEDNKDIISEKSKEYRRKNKEKILKYSQEYKIINSDKIKKYLEDNKETISEKRKIYYEKNKENILEYSKEYRKTNQYKLSEYYNNPVIKSHRSDIQKEYREQNRDKLSEKKKLYYINNKESIRLYKVLNKENINIYQKKRFDNNIVLKLERVIRLSISSSIKRNGYSKNSKTEEILGCKFEEFKIYLESKFEDWMTWENRGLYNGELNYGWDIDHIIPSSTALTEHEIITLNHYSNLQPLCSYVNRVIKRNKLDFI